MPQVLKEIPRPPGKCKTVKIKTKSQNTNHTLTISNSTTIIENREILSILIKNSISLFLSFQFWILTFRRHPILSSNKNFTAGGGFSKRLHGLFQTIRLILKDILN